jgi:putative oxidoreductase
MEKLQASVALVARLMLAFIFVIEDWGKLGNYGEAVRYMESHTVPGMLLPLVILTELGGGLLIACGFLSRVAALTLAGFCLLTALLFHADFADANEFIQFMKDITMAGGFLVLVAFGPSEWSIDAWQARRAHARASSPGMIEQQG